MTFVYIVLGVILLAIAIFLLDYRDKMTKNILIIKDYKDEVNHLNQQLDEVSQKLEELDEPLSKIQNTSQKILKRMRK